MDKNLAKTEINACIEHCYSLYKNDKVDSEILYIVNKLKTVLKSLED